jgi:large subunit ribosomal protein L24
VVNARLGLKGRVGALRINLTAGATGKQDAFAAGHFGALAATELRLEAQLQADDGATLLGLAGLERFAVADRRPAVLSVSASGPLDQALKFEGKLAAGGIDVAGEGSLRLAAEQPGIIDFDRLHGSLYGHKLRGRLAVKLAEAAQVDGEIEAETLDVPAIVAAAIGMRSRSGQSPQASTWSSEPFVLNATGLSGRIAFKAERASLSPTLDARQLRGTARLGPSEVVFEDIDGELAKGRLSGRLAFGSNAEGLVARAKVDLSGAEMAAVYPRAGRPPISGRLTFKAEVEGTGLSPAAFIGSLTGSGAIELDDAQFANLSPRVFDAVIRAVDLGIPADANRIRDFVATALDSAGLPVARANAVIKIAAGQLRLTDVVTQADGVDVALVASLDLTNALLDANLTMSGRQTIAGAEHPTLMIALKGALPTPQRSIDANPLANWLALRSVDRQAKQLEELERAQREAQERAEREALERAPRELPEPSQTIPVAPMDDPGTTPAAASAPDANINAGSTSPVSAAATSGIAPGNDAPPLPPPVDIPTPPQPRAAPHANDGATPERPPASRYLAPKPTTRRPGPPLDLLGGSYR